MTLMLSLLLSAIPAQAQNVSRAIRAVAPVSAPAVVAPTLPSAGLPLALPSLPAPTLTAPVLPRAAASLAAPAAAAAAAKAEAAPSAAAAPAEAKAEAALAAPAAAKSEAAVAAPAPQPQPFSAAESAWAQRLPDRGRKLEILMAAAEAHPFVKTGGLADVVDDLGRGLAARGHRVTLILPKFSSVDEKRFALEPVPGSFQVRIGDRVETTRLWKTSRQGVDVYFLDNPNMYSRPGPYGYDGYDGYGKRDYPDNDERFLFHARASLEAMRFLGRKPDIVHAHDWHVGLLPALLKTAYAADPFFSAARSLLTIHNIAYQGLFPWTAYEKTGLGKADEPHGAYERYGMFSYLKAGLVNADAITTVSPTYAREIQTAAYGEGMQELLTRRAHELTGILNGIDLRENDPAANPLVHRTYSAADVEPGKAANKTELQRRLGLEPRPDAPVFAVASRLAHQKGIDLVLEAADAVLAAGGQLVITGSGETELEEAVAALAEKHPGRVARHKFDTVFVKLVYAAADFLLMPSRFEPCGLSQLIAQRYGTLPIATKTGGLADTIRNGVDGFHAAEFSAQALRDAVARAAAFYRDPAALARARAAAMAKDSGWDASIARYLELYRSLLP